MRAIIFFGLREKAAEIGIAAQNRARQIKEDFTGKFATESRKNRISF